MCEVGVVYVGITSHLRTGWCCIMCINYTHHRISARSYHSYDLVADMYLFTKFQDEHANPMEKDTTLLHSTVLIYALLHIQPCCIL